MDLSEGFSDGELPTASPDAGGEQCSELDMLAVFSDEESPQDQSTDASIVGRQIAVPCDHALQVAVAVTTTQETQPLVPQSAGKAEQDFGGYSLKGKVGMGRHGGPLERAMVCAHMRAEKRARKAHEGNVSLAHILQDCTFSKDGASFNVVAKRGAKGGVQVVLEKRAARGNRYVRKIHFSKFIRASYGINTSNMALSVMLDVDASTIPRLQKTCAGIVMVSQARLLARLLKYCQTNKPLTVHHQLKWDETTVATTLNPGGVSHSVKSAWSVLVIRAKLLVTWESGAMWRMRLVMPTIPLMSSSADQIYYALRHHPSLFTVHELVRLIGLTAQERCCLHEVDGAYANLRLHHHLLSLQAYDSTTQGGSFLDTARCQSHATHLISVSMLALIGGNLLSRYYGLCVFLRNLGYLLRLQLALREWIHENLVIVPDDGSDPDPLMQETVDFLQTWHHAQEAEDPAESKTHFQKNLHEFKELWNGSYTGQPTHRRKTGQTQSRADTVSRMTAAFVTLLLTCLPSVPAPNKWTKIFPASDFVGVGLLINNFLPRLFEIAFRPVMFSTDTCQEEADPRLVEGLFFHAVQGKRYFGSRAFLLDHGAQWCCRCWMIVSEHLRRLVYFWLRNLSSEEKQGQSNRFPLFKLLDVRTSAAWAVLQNIAHQLLDDRGRRRLCIIWRGSGCSSYRSWCSSCPQEVRDLRRALVSLYGWVYRRHVVYWQQFPWTLTQLVDDEADPAVVQQVKDRWDMSHACCVSAGLARDLKRRHVTSDMLAHDPTWRALLKGVAFLLDMSIADVECKHALSRHWADRPFPTITAKHINREAAVSVEEARQEALARHPADHSERFNRPEDKSIAGVSIKQKQIRGKSAYMFFRDDFLKFQKETGGSDKTNPCSTEFWQQLRQSWSALPASRREYYEELAVQSQSKAEQQRKQSKLPSSSSIPESAAPPAQAAAVALRDGVLQPLHNSVVPYDPWVLASGAFTAGEFADAAQERCEQGLAQFFNITRTYQSLGQLNVRGLAFATDRMIRSASPIIRMVLKQFWFCLSDCLEDSICASPIDRMILASDSASPIDRMILKMFCLCFSD